MIQQYEQDYDACNLCGSKTQLTLITNRCNVKEHIGKSVCGKCRINIVVDNVCECGSYRFTKQNGFRVCQACGLVTDQKIFESRRNDSEYINVFGLNIGQKRERNLHWQRLSTLNNYKTEYHQIVKQEIYIHSRHILTQLGLSKLKILVIEKLVYDTYLKTPFNTKMRNLCALTGATIYFYCIDHGIYLELNQLYPLCDEKKLRYIVMHYPKRVPNDKSILPKLLVMDETKIIPQHIRLAALNLLNTHPELFRNTLPRILAATAIRIAYEIEREFCVTANIARMFNCSRSAIFQRLKTTSEKLREKMTHPHASADSERIHILSTYYV